MYSAILTGLSGTKVNLVMDWMLFELWSWAAVNVRNAGDGFIDSKIQSYQEAINGKKKKWSYELEDFWNLSIIFNQCRKGFYLYFWEIFIS